MKTIHQHKRILLCLLLFFVVNISAQEKISLVPPDGWIESQRNEVMNTLYNKYSYSEKVLQEIEESGKNSIQLLGYYTNERKGLYRPNIQVILRPNSSENFETFQLEINKSLEGFSKMINGFAIREQPKKIIIGGKDAISIKFKGYHLTNDNKKSWFESKLIVIPAGHIFYQITLNQSPGDDFDKDFNKVIKSIKFE